VSTHYNPKVPQRPPAANKRFSSFRNDGIRKVRSNKNIEKHHLMLGINRIYRRDSAPAALTNNFNDDNDA
jgi:hypothetical protein